MTSKTASIPNPSPTSKAPSPVATAAAAAAAATTLSPTPSVQQQQQQQRLLRRRRESSEDFLAIGSLGSIADVIIKPDSNAEGVEDEAGEDSKSRADCLELSTTTSKGSANNNNNNNNINARSASIGLNAASTNLSPSLSVSAASSPEGRRPFRKRKGSVDFKLFMDDNDSTSLSNLPTLLPQHATAPSGPINASLLLLPSSSKNRSRINSDDVTIDSTSLSKVLPPMEALPPIEPLPPIDDTASALLHPPPSPTTKTSAVVGVNTKTTTTTTTTTTTDDENDNNNDKGRNKNDSATTNGIPTLTNREHRGLSFGSSKTEGRGLDHLDTLGVEAAQNAAKIRKESVSERSAKSSHGSNDEDGSNTSQGTLNSQSQRFLLEALLGDGTESLVLNPSQRERLGSFDIAIALGRERLGSFDAAAAAAAIGKTYSTNSRDDSKKGSGNNKTQTNLSGTHIHCTTNRDRLSSIGGRRDRLESWGAMSDLSAAGIHDQNSEAAGSGGTATAAALAATIYTSLANDVSAAAGAADGNDSISSFLVHDMDATIPTKISVNRDRLNSVASMATDPSALFHIAAAGSNSAGSMSAEAMALMGDHLADHLADLATSMEAIMSRERGHDDSEVSSTASPLIGAASDLATSRAGRPRSSSVSSLINIDVDLNVDYDAVAAAVDAAEAAAVAIDLTSLTVPKEESGTKPAGSASNSNKNRKKRALPLARSKNQLKQQLEKPNASSSSDLFNDDDDDDVLKSSSQEGERDMEEIRARARAAAGYVPPSSVDGSTGSSLPPKKRAKLFDGNGQAMTPSATRPSKVPSSNHKTPVISNRGSSKYDGTPSYCDTPASSSGKGQPSQKWESMFESLLEFVEEQKREETRGLTEAQKKDWEWDGNVPTTYKTKDGKALGRWVNNQRSAKSKGTLKDDRETRLVDAGLKWSVLASSSWNDMLEELRVYISEQERAGKKWNGNVPTNYTIKVTKDKKAFIKDDEEDKNLGRWVNRQRSLYQAGKLRKDRQLALENIGLKWSMLATTSWDSMFETLEEYVKEKTKNGAKWDGNVPANYKTHHDPPRALGRWINRQRSTFGKKKLKTEYVNKLSSIGLRWSVHDRRQHYQSSTTTSNTPDGVGSSSVQNKLDEGDDDDDDDDDDGNDDNSTNSSNSGEKEPSKKDEDAPVPDTALSHKAVEAVAAAETSPEVKGDERDEKKNSADT
ncbi:helicase domain protein [Nitzschia inconspicua]|uniref:Helicase domain protein n=1 Tax=Nitzschia inconspicua TaxID=303405 RepID=A0A9K3PUN8_9STRA|nr:helicase domain protein [Nitzschia inconspicua]